MLSISILGINERKKIELLNESKFDYIHLDIMDGKFVPNTTLEFDRFKELLKNNKKPLDVHLMVEDVISYIDMYIELNPLYITFHLEAVKNPVRIIEYIKKHNIKVGMSIKPNTDIDKIRPYLNLLDLVLVMSVEPGFGGQRFIESTTERVNKLKQIKEEFDYNYLIEVDGGINNETCKLVNNANILVVGSYVTNTDNYQRQINKILSVKKGN